MISKRSNTASAKMGRDIAPGVPAQKGSVMEEVVRVASDRALVSDQAATRLAPTRFDPSRRREVNAAIHRSLAIKAASERASIAEMAAQWLFDYGKNCVGKDAASITFKLSFASACVGAKEAEEVIKKAIFAMLPEIISTAKQMTLRDMDALVELIAPRDSDGSGEADKT